MHHYPVFLSLRGKHCLVVGAGKVGMRKIKTLLNADPASILVLDIQSPSDEQAETLNHPLVTFEQRPFSPSDVEGVFLAIAATPDRTVNQAVATACEHAGILCNIADAPQQSNFIVPSCVRRGDLSVAISTGGHSPALSKRIRRDLENVFGKEYEVFVDILGRLRPLMLAKGTTTQENTAIFRAVVESDLLDALAEEDLDRAASSLRETLPQEMHEKIGELLHGSI